MEHMETEIELVLFGILACVIIYSLLSNLIGRTFLTLPIIFVAIGYLVSEPIGMIGEHEALREYARYLAEITLILILFADASHVRFSKLKETFQLPLRMLVIGMPLTIALGTLTVWLISPEGGFAMALLTAAVLTPTDAALGQSVVSNPKVPLRLSQTINVESGLNDGLVLPFVLLGAVLAATGMNELGTDGLASAAIIQVILGPIAGIIIGWFVAKGLDFAENSNWVMESAQGVVFLATAFGCYLGAELIGGNGFIAAFIGGAVFGNTYRHDLHFISEFMEGTGQILTMAAFLVFGAIMLPDGISHVTSTALVIAILFLTIVRILPIWVSLTGTSLALKEKLFLGWFGPRGLASILFTLIMMAEFEFPNEEEFLACVSMTVFMSVILHGITATPFANRISGENPKPTHSN
ncbi:MAG: cation:proton antiporter [Salaquimonas sp.]